MQRLRKAFLLRKAVKTGCHCLLMFLIFYIGHGDGLGVVSNNMCQREADMRLQGFCSGMECPNMCLQFPDWDSYGDVETEICTTNLHSQQEHKDYVIGVNEKVDMENTVLQGQEKDHSKNIMLVGYDEFKHKAVSPKNRTAVGQGGTVKHRVDPSGAEYNYASASKGAKVLAFNKEAKGASYILGKDKDKYLRNPCSAEQKFVVIELSEETLVDTIAIANFEHHSSNFKDFELFGSSVYPTEMWEKLGNFTAKNVKQSQRFTLPKPEWVRYVKLNLLSHYGSEFYCTVSLVQVYGIDAVERMLEDLITAQDDLTVFSETKGEQNSGPAQPMPSPSGGSLKEEDSNIPLEDPEPKQGVSASDMGDQSGDRRSQPTGRMPGDTVLKILMQKVRSLDLNLSVLERYLEELHSRYSEILKDVDGDIAEKDALLEKLRSDIMNLAISKEVMVKDVSGLLAWKSIVSLQMDNLKRENAILRFEVQKIVENQAHMENKGIVVLLVSLICSFIAIIKLIVHVVLRKYKGKEQLEKYSGSDIPWVLLLLGSGFIGFILLL